MGEGEQRREWKLEGNAGADLSSSRDRAGAEGRQNEKCSGVLLGTRDQNRGDLVRSRFRRARRVVLTKSEQKTVHASEIGGRYMITIGAGGLGGFDVMRSIAARSIRLA